MVEFNTFLVFLSSLLHGLVYCHHLKGLLRKSVVEPTHMWWLSTLVQISLFRLISCGCHTQGNNDIKEIMTSNYACNSLSKSLNFGQDQHQLKEIDMFDGGFQGQKI